MSCLIWINDVCTFKFCCIWYFKCLMTKLMLLVALIRLFWGNFETFMSQNFYLMWVNQSWQNLLGMRTDQASGQFYFFFFFFLNGSFFFFFFFTNKMVQYWSFQFLFKLLKNEDKKLILKKNVMSKFYHFENFNTGGQTV